MFFSTDKNVCDGLYDTAVETVSFGFLLINIFIDLSLFLSLHIYIYMEIYNIYILYGGL